VVLVAVIAIEFCIVFWVADFVHSERGLSRADAALATTAFLGAILAGRIISSRLLFRLPPQRLLLGSLAVAGVGFLIFWLLQPITVVAAGLILAGLGVANLYPTTLALAVGTAPAQLDQAAARGSLASGTAILALPLLLGSMADSIGIAAAFGLVGVLTVVAVAILLAATALLRRTGAIPHTGQSA
jgi:fucose permease